MAHADACTSVRPRNFTSVCSTRKRRRRRRRRGARKGKKKGGIAVYESIEISDSNLNSAFERQPCSTAKQLEVGTVCAAWHKKTAEKWAPPPLSPHPPPPSSPSLPPLSLLLPFTPFIPACAPLWKNRFKLALRVPKPRFKKLVKNCQRFSSFILFSPPRPLRLSLLCSTNAPHASPLCSVQCSFSLDPRYTVFSASAGLSRKGLPYLVLGAINIRD